MGHSVGRRFCNPISQTITWKSQAHVTPDHRTMLGGDQIKGLLRVPRMQNGVFLVEWQVQQAGLS